MISGSGASGPLGCVHITAKCISVGSVQLPWTGAKIDMAMFSEPSERLGDGRKAVGYVRSAPAQAHQRCSNLGKIHQCKHDLHLPVCPLLCWVLQPGLQGGWVRARSQLPPQHVKSSGILRWGSLSVKARLSLSFLEWLDLSRWDPLRCLQHVQKRETNKKNQTKQTNTPNNTTFIQMKHLYAHLILEM